MVRGLTHRFVIKNGKFQLTQGRNKIRDNIRMLMSFDTVARIYYDDFCPRLMFLLQKPGSTVAQYKTLVLGRLKKIIVQYVPYVKVNTVDFRQFRENAEKRLEVTVNYDYTGKEGGEDTSVTFI